MRNNRFSDYGFWGLVHISLSFIFTKLCFKQSRLLRIPFFIRGKSRIDFGSNLTTGVSVRLDAFSLLKKEQKLIVFGKNVEINDYVHIAAINSVHIGNNVLIASKVFITDHNHGEYSSKNPSSPLEIPKDRLLHSLPVKICDNVWIGEFVSILPGVEIGEGSIIGCNSVVNSSIPSFCIAVGSPAKVIKVFNFESMLWERV